MVTMSDAGGGVKALAVFALAVLLSACSNYSPDAGHEIVLIKKPLIFGHGGIDPEPVKTGRTFPALTTDGVDVYMQPQKFEVNLPDTMTSDGVPISVGRANPPDSIKGQRIETATSRRDNRIKRRLNSGGKLKGEMASSMVVSSIGTRWANMMSPSLSEVEASPSLTSHSPGHYISRLEAYVRFAIENLVEPGRRHQAGWILTLPQIPRCPSYGLILITVL
jgi:hypothetical protein